MLHFLARPTVLCRAVPVPTRAVLRRRDLKPANLMIAGNLNADTEQLFLDSGVIKVRACPDALSSKERSKDTPAEIFKFH